LDKSSTYKESVGKLEPVSPSQEPTAPDGKWLPIFKAFNPFGAIAESYAKTLAYKIETKRLEVERQRIIEQAEIAHDVIDKTYRLKMEKLEHRRIALVGFYTTVNAELDRLHIERMEVLKMAQFSQQKMSDPSTPMEEKLMYKEMTIEMTRELPRFGDKANASLQQLVQALPPVDIANKLLEG